MQNILLNLFIKLLGMSLEASLIAVVVIAMRVIFCRAPKWTHCIMWGLVAVRLFCPFTPQSDLSIMPSENLIERSIKNSITVISQEGKTTETNQVSEPTSNNEKSENFHTETPTPSTTVSRYAGTPSGGNIGTIDAPQNEPIFNKTWLTVFTNVWLLGLLIISIYSAISFVILRHRISDAVLLKENIYLSDRVNCAFLFGIIKPKIYLPFGISDENSRQIIAHEKVHLRRRDNVTKVLAFLLASVYWFNPIILLSCILYCLDIELACDESVVRGKDVGQRKAYSRALLECSSAPCSFSIYNSIPIAFGKTAVKRRVVNVLKNKKPAIWIVCAALVVTAIAAAVMLTRPKTYTDDIPEDLHKAIITSIFEKNGAVYTEVSATDASDAAFYGSGEFDRSDVECIGAGYKVLGAKQSDNKVELYILCSAFGYGFRDGCFVDNSGYSQVPTLITFETGKDGSYILVDTQEAKDGGLYKDSVYKMFPRSVARKVFSLSNNEVAKELSEQCDQCAAAYLKKIGRQAKVGEYADFDFKILTDYGVSVEVSNAMLELHPEYGIYVGNFETIESGKRYVYSQEWSPDREHTGNSYGTITFLKREYGTNKEIEKFSYKVEGENFSLEGADN